MPGDDLTHGPPAIKNAGGSHHRFGRINRHSLRDGLRLISRSPRGPGSLAPVAPEKLVSQELDLSVGRPGPRDFAVRFSHVRLTCRPHPSHPRLTCRDERAYVPLHRGGMGEKIVVICPTPQAPIRAADWHDGQFAHGVYARFACRRRRNAPYYRFITADHVASHALHSFFRSTLSHPLLRCAQQWTEQGNQLTLPVRGSLGEDGFQLASYCVPGQSQLGSDRFNAVSGCHAGRETGLGFRKHEGRSEY
jgi:hypothetical protein